MKISQFILTCACLLLPLSANAINKCVGADGKIVYSDTPCDHKAKRSEIKSQYKPSTPPAVVADTSSDADKLRALRKQRRKGDVHEEIERREANIDRLRRQMDSEMASLRTKKGSASSNYAGATWEQSISSEMQAVASSYDVKIKMEQERLQALRSEAKVLGEAP